MKALGSVLSTAPGPLSLGPRRPGEGAGVEVRIG